MSDYFVDPTINPPEVREPTDTYRVVEFYVDLNGARPELALFDLIRQWLAKHAPLLVHHLSISYHRPTDNEPALLVGLLTIGEYLDVG